MRIESDRSNANTIVHSNEILDLKDRYANQKTKPYPYLDTQPYIYEIWPQDNSPRHVGVADGDDDDASIGVEIIDLLLHLASGTSGGSSPDWRPGPPSYK
jgi:hypothetical protein